MNTPPTEITTPPDGYEWTPEIRHARKGEHYAVWDETVPGRWRAVAGDDTITNSRATTHGPFPILRKIKPPTVMVELPRDLVIHATQGRFGMVDDRWEQLHQACAAALEAEDD